MKVIIAGFSKTGTKTMNEALTLLGYNVYDFFEHFWVHGDDWIKIFAHGGTKEDFFRMYKDVDAVADTPAFFFWEQIHEAFPDSKIILTMRDEETWIKSMANQIKDNFEVKLQGLRYLAASTLLNPFKISRFDSYLTDQFRIIFGTKMRNPNANELILRMLYRRHNAYVQAAAPQDKLLIYKVSDGWEPLCKFLEKEAPKIPFPHKNKNVTASYEILSENKVAIENLRIVKRRFNACMFVTLAVILAIVVAVIL